MSATLIAVLVEVFSGSEEVVFHFPWGPLPLGSLYLLFPADFCRNI
jgi:hypothetical protein